MKFMSKVVLILAVLCWPVVGQARTLPCVNVYIHNDTAKQDVIPVADQIAEVELVKTLQNSESVCFKGATDLSSGDWQTRKHDKLDVLITFTAGPMDDGNGVGPVGKKIEVIAYTITTYSVWFCPDSCRKREGVFS